MTKQKFIDAFIEPHFPEADLVSENPYLPEGIKCYSTNPNDANKVIGGKIGPGYWNELKYISGKEDTFTVTTDVTNPLGDATGTLLGKTAIEILELQLNPYKEVEITSVQNNAQVSYKTNAVVEIGKPLASIIVQLVVANIGNINLTTPINIGTNGSFQEGDFGYNGNIVLTKTVPSSPILPITYNIDVKVKDKNGNYSATKRTTVAYAPNIIVGVKQTDSITPTEFANIASRVNKISNTYKGQYSFLIAGFGYIGIPSMLNPTNVQFKDVTNPNALGIIDMTYVGTLTVNNGVTTYDYEIYRTTYYLNSSAIIEVS